MAFYRRNIVRKTHGLLGLTGFSSILRAQAGMYLVAAILFVLFWLRSSYDCGKPGQRETAYIEQLPLECLRVVLASAPKLCTYSRWKHLQQKCVPIGVIVGTRHVMLCTVVGLRAAKEFKRHSVWDSSVGIISGIVAVL